MSTNTTGLKISEDVIKTAAKLAALDVKGVAGLCGEVNPLSKMLGSSPITVSLMGDVAAISMKIKVKSSFKACSVAEKVQEAVKETVQNMAGVAVARVNVTVQDIEFE